MRFDSMLPLAARFAVPIAAALLAGACAMWSAAPTEDRRAAPARAPAPPVTAAVPVPVPSSRAAEPDTRPSTYTVKRGDTLAAIALEFGYDYRELAAWNGIENPDRIFVGQVLRLAPPGETRTATATDSPAGVVTAPLRSAPPVVESRPSTPPPTAAAVAPAPRNTESLKVSPKAVKEPYSEAMAREMAKAPPEPPTIARAEPSRTSPPPPAAAGAPLPAAAGAAAPPTTSTPGPPAASTPALADTDDDLDWTWPARGKLVTGFSDTANLKGIDIAGPAGTPVVASAGGKVVYAGTGLRGYGKLVIIKHNKTFLSAYAHNREILVKEGQQVARGQKIAEMGSTDADQVKLHFEIRRLGKPMDPLKYLPPG
jgi:lipoprotein NlpD